MSAPAEEVFRDHFLETRCKLLDIAANLDRLDAADGQLNEEDAELRGRIDDALIVLRSNSKDRAAQIQQIFSRTYDAGWRRKMEL